MNEFDFLEPRLNGYSVKSSRYGANLPNIVWGLVLGSLVATVKLDQGYFSVVPQCAQLLSSL